MRGLLLVTTFLPVCAPCQSSDAPAWTFRIGPSFGQTTIGSEDTRRGTVWSLGYSRPEKRLTFRGTQADLLIEGYYFFNRGGGFEDIPVNTMHSYGAMATAQYRVKEVRGTTVHFDLSWGLVYNSITTRDLDSRLNSTPAIGIGVRRGRADFTVRFFHMSNGGTSGNNQGSNNIQYLFSWRI